MLNAPNVLKPVFVTVVVTPLPASLASKGSGGHVDTGRIFAR
jgi:hypothetical protein